MLSTAKLLAFAAATSISAVSAQCNAVIAKATTTSPCVFSCPKCWDPVCGSNGMTYANTCALEEAHCLNSSIVLASNGSCPVTTTPPATKPTTAPPTDCVVTCAPILVQVCGSNNKTYSSPCELAAAQCKDPTIKLVSQGACAATTEPKAAKWGQCGGIGWTGPTACKDSTCTKLNDWYSQCL